MHSKERTFQLHRKTDFLHNSISTGKYSLLSFVPRFVYEQFIQKYANSFFLVTGTLQTIKEITPTSQFGTLAPLAFIIILTAIKEVFEDSKRHAQDMIVNSTSTLVLERGVFVKKQWRQVTVGDIVKVENKQNFPADMILLNSSEQDSQSYIETSQLDGETNLKIRQGIVETNFLKTEKDLGQFEATLRCEAPNNSLYTFEATMTFGGKNYPIGPEQLLLRGAQLRNTHWVYGLVVFTGHETKLLQNSTTTPVKKTKVEHMVNTQIIFLFLCLIVIAIVCSGGGYIRQTTGSFESKIMLLKPSEALVNAGKSFLTYIVLFNNLIPLSLVITLEFVKLVIAFSIDSDLDLYHAPNDTPATAKTSSLVEELGQVDYIFSDKTGTLTCNMMEFKMATIGGVVYGVPTDDTRLTVKSSEELRIMSERDSQIHAFLTLLSVCHTVIPEGSLGNDLQYQSASPDETALVEGVVPFGFQFHVRKPKSVIVRIHGKDQEFHILAVNEFNSTRKRMSIVVRMPDGSLKLMIKGADTVILDRLSKSNNYLDITNNHLAEFASEGLRTLCIAERVISEQEYQQWKQKFDEAATSIDTRQELLSQVAEDIERDLVLLGATAIEDKLQDGVPNTIHTLMEAGIKVWVLTGDRQETAINIGYSCRLITANMELFVCEAEEKEDIKAFLQSSLEKALKGSNEKTPLLKMNIFSRMWRNVKKQDVGKFRKDYGMDMRPMGLVIDGKKLQIALDAFPKEFLHLALLCKAVICCRVSPLQKALVVKLVKDNVAQTVTLAIGDGANDVTMIQAAHVGVGISGQEGLQAARNADFAIAQFRFLQKLLLVHGAWSYSRISKVIVFSFYKNVTMYLIQLWFTLTNGFSGQTLFETWSSVSSYNVLWTLLPPLAIGIFDQFVSAEYLMKYPELYRLGQQDVFYNNGIFFQWFFNAVLHSLLIFFGWTFVLGEGMILNSGLVADNWSFGQMVYATCLATVFVKTLMVLDSWARITSICVIGSLVAFFALFPAYVVVGPMNLFGKFAPLSPELFNLNNVMWSNWVFWFALVLIPIAINLRDFLWKSWKRLFRPKPYHIVQEIQRTRAPDYRPKQKWFFKIKNATHLTRTASGRVYPN
ncbi:hypothetical protein EDD86DRAFT_207875 [Gorgonomyces haynaldii]|nr:hypothetical protein EDD86DRAFT_207875 [Gorgonomyces haynaldii]